MTNTNERNAYISALLSGIIVLMGIGGMNNILASQTTLGALQLMISALSAHSIYLINK